MKNIIILFIAVFPFLVSAQEVKFSDLIQVDSLFAFWVAFVYIKGFSLMQALYNSMEDLGIVFWILIYKFQKDLELISTKLDSLKASIDHLNMRLASLERIAKGEYEKTW